MENEEKEEKETLQSEKKHFSGIILFTSEKSSNLHAVSDLTQNVNSCFYYNSWAHEEEIAQ